MLRNARPGPRGRPAPSGYTIMELIAVLMIAATLMTFGAQAFNKAAGQRATTSARDTYVWLARRARALAVQRGTNVRLTLLPATQQAKLALGSTLLDQVYFNQQFKTTVSLSSGDSLALCYTPRGVAVLGTGTGCVGQLSTPVTVTFQQGQISATAVMQVLGQAEAK